MYFPRWNVINYLCPQVEKISMQKDIHSFFSRLKNDPRGVLLLFHPYFQSFPNFQQFHSIFFRSFHKFGKNLLKSFSFQKIQWKKKCWKTHFYRWEHEKIWPGSPCKLIDINMLWWTPSFIRYVVLYKFLRFFS